MVKVNRLAFKLFLTGHNTSSVHRSKNTFKLLGLCLSLYFLDRISNVKFGDNIAELKTHNWAGSGSGREKAKLEHSSGLTCVPHKVVPHNWQAT